MNSVDTIVWFREDLRLEDNLAISSSEGSCLALYLWAPQEEGGWEYGGASRCWLHAALEDLERQLRERGGQLVIVDASESSSLYELQRFVKLYSVRRVVWNRRYEPAAVKRDTDMKRILRAEGVEVQSYNGRLLHEPTKVVNQSGRPFQVFTPFWKHCLQKTVEQPVVENAECRQWLRSDQGIELGRLDLLPTSSWGMAMMQSWVPTRVAALKRLEKMVQGGAAKYEKLRDRPDYDGTSRLSPYLRFGQIGPRELYHALTNGNERAHSAYLRQLYWRDFAHHLLYHFPNTVTQPLKPQYALFPWEEHEEIKERWRKGRTGYPIVDAGLRQLWQTGWMHNRVRMIVGSLLVKHCLQDWMTGARWFWDTLVDADLANNTLGWQWIAGCGADASPYFRVFNPMIQGKKFDPRGDYVRQYLPELAELPIEFIHCPWEASDMELAAANVRLGDTYPKPVIEHGRGREKALNAYQQFKDKVAEESAGMKRK